MTIRWLASAMLLAAMLAGLLACGSRRSWDQAPRQQHVVRTGETLYSIAFRYGKNPDDLSRWNRIGDGSLIYPGQVIHLQPPAGARASGSAGRRPLPAIPADLPPPWAWPAAGRVVVEFGEQAGGGAGILIAGRTGEPIRAAASGRVVYAGGGLIGYGKLIIIKHNDTYLSAYGHNASLLVKEGEKTSKGQRIATMGEGPGREPRLHFEIRRNGEPVDPRQYLPAR